MMPDTLPDIRDLWDFNDPEASETRFREWLDRTPNSTPFHLELKTQIARTFSLRSRFEEAHSLLDDVEPYLATAPGVAVRYYLERGRTFNSDKQPDQAKALLLQAWDEAREAGLDDLAVDAAHMVAIAETDAAQQIAWNERAIVYAEASNQSGTGRWLGSLYNNMGWTYHDLGEYERALDYFQKALVWHEVHGRQHTLRIARWAVGRGLRSLQRHDEALAVQIALRAELDADGEDGPFNLEELGELYLTLDQEAKAKTYFARAYPLLKAFPWVAEARLERIRSLID